jgi:hypothetical protein
VGSSSYSGDMSEVINSARMRKTHYNKKRPTSTPVSSTLREYQEAFRKVERAESRLTKSDEAVRSSNIAVCWAHHQRDMAHLDPVIWPLSEENRPAAIAIKRTVYEQNLKDAKLAQEACEIKRLAFMAKLDAAKIALRDKHSYDPSRTSVFSLFHGDIVTILLRSLFSENQFLDFQHLCMCSSASATAGRLIIANPWIISSLFSRFRDVGHSDFGFRHIRRDGHAYLMFNPELEPDVVIIPELEDFCIVLISMTSQEPDRWLTYVMYYRPFFCTFHLLKGHISAFSLIKGSLIPTAPAAAFTNSERMQYKALTLDHSPALDVTADPDVEILSNSKLLVDMDPFRCSLLLFHGVAFRDEDGAIKITLIQTSDHTQVHRYQHRLICHCEFDDDNRLRLHLSRNIFWKSYA